VHVLHNGQLFLPQRLQLKADVAHIGAALGAE
jgi:hypothetical protein